MNTRRGFTLVELLVVVSIIGILAAIIYANFDGARQTARNSAIKAELKEMQLALEIYRAQEGRYPPVDTSAMSCYDDSGAVHTAENSPGTCSNYIYIDGLSPEFIGALPESQDSGNANCSFEYQVEAAGGWYKLTAAECFDGASDASEGVQEDEEFSRCPSSCGTCAGSTYNAGYVGSAPFYESMAVYSSGGECE